MVDTNIWQPGVFRPLLHRVPADARQYYLCGLPVRFSACNCPTKPGPEQVSLERTALLCGDCLADAFDDWPPDHTDSQSPACTTERAANERNTQHANDV